MQAKDRVLSTASLLTLTSARSLHAVCGFSLAIARTYYATAYPDLRLGQSDAQARGDYIYFIYVFIAIFFETITAIALANQGAFL